MYWYLCSNSQGMKFKAEKDDLLVQIIKEKVGYESSTKARKMIKRGNVLVDGKQEQIPSTIIKTGQEITVSFSRPTDAVKSRKKFPFKVVFEDPYFIAFVKPQGFPMITDNRKMRSVHSEIRFWLDGNPKEEELYPINKIDKRESGIILAARNLAIKKEFEPIGGLLKMRYYVITEGVIEGDDHTLAQGLQRNKIGLLFPANGGSNSLQSRIDCRVMMRSSTNTLLKVTPTNHLKNQIRAQLSIAKAPVIGDKKYKAKTNPMKRLGIHLFSLDFKHPKSGQWVEIRTPVPKEFLNLIKASKPKKGK